MFSIFCNFILIQFQIQKSYKNSAFFHIFYPNILVIYILPYVLHHHLQPCLSISLYIHMSLCICACTCTCILIFVLLHLSVSETDGVKISHCSCGFVSFFLVILMVLLSCSVRCMEFLHYIFLMIFALNSISKYNSIASLAFFW